MGRYTIRDRPVRIRLFSRTEERIAGMIRELPQLARHPSVRSAEQRPFSCPSRPQGPPCARLAKDGRKSLMCFNPTPTLGKKTPPEYPGVCPRHPARQTKCEKKNKKKENGIIIAAAGLPKQSADAHSALVGTTRAMQCQSDGVVAFNNDAARNGRHAGTYSTRV